MCEFFFIICLYKFVYFDDIFLGLKSWCSRVRMRKSINLWLSFFCLVSQWKIFARNVNPIVSENVCESSKRGPTLQRTSYINASFFLSILLMYHIFDARAGGKKVSFMNVILDIGKMPCWVNIVLGCLFGPVFSSSIRKKNGLDLTHKQRGYYIKCSCMALEGTGSLEKQASWRISKQNWPWTTTRRAHNKRIKMCHAPYIELFW